MARSRSSKQAHLSSARLKALPISRAHRYERRKKTRIAIDEFQVTKGKSFELCKHPSALKAPLHKSKKDCGKRLREFREEIDDLQSMMYAHDRHSLLLIFQAMDAAGKDGTIRHVMSGVNVHGVQVSSFKNQVLLRSTMMSCVGPPASCLSVAR